MKFKKKSGISVKVLMLFLKECGWQTLLLLTECSFGVTFACSACGFVPEASLGSTS